MSEAEPPFRVSTLAVNKGANNGEYLCIYVIEDADDDVAKLRYEAFNDRNQMSKKIRHSVDEHLVRKIGNRSEEPITEDEAKYACALRELVFSGATIVRSNTEKLK
jgi:hypothetical protein